MQESERPAGTSSPPTSALARLRAETRVLHEQIEGGHMVETVERQGRASSEVRGLYLSAQLAANRREALRLVIEEGLSCGSSVAEVQLEVIQEAQREICWRSRSPWPSTHPRRVTAQLVRELETHAAALTARVVALAQRFLQQVLSPEGARA